MKVLLLNASPKKTGATQEILRTVEEALPKATCGELVCLGDYQVQYCLGCKTCYQSGCCVHQDDMPVLLDKMDEADVLVIGRTCRGSLRCSSTGARLLATPTRTPIGIP